MALPSSRSTRWSSTNTRVATWGAMNASSPSSICVPELPSEFSMCSSANAVPAALPFSTIRLAWKGGGVSSSMGSATDSASTASSSAGGASSAATGAVSEVDSSSISPASTWMDGGGSGSGGLSGSIFGGGGLGASLFLAKGVPQSKQNFA